MKKFHSFVRLTREFEILSWEAIVITGCTNLKDTRLKCRRDFLKPRRAFIQKISGICFARLSYVRNTALARTLIAPSRYCGLASRWNVTWPVIISHEITARKSPGAERI